MIIKIRIKIQILKVAFKAVTRRKLIAWTFSIKMKNVNKCIKFPNRILDKDQLIKILKEFKRGIHKDKTRNQ